MSSVSGWAFATRCIAYNAIELSSFYALGIGLGFATQFIGNPRPHEALRFYALGIGLGFATK